MENQKFQNVFKPDDPHETLNNLKDYSPKTTLKKWIVPKKKSKDGGDFLKNDEEKQTFVDSKMEPQKKKWTRDYKFQILYPSYCDPIYRRFSKFIKHQNHVALQYDEKES